MLDKKSVLERASNLLVGGVNSPVRAFYKPTPLVAVGGEGPYLVDLEHGKLLDHVLGYGPLILGHRHPAVLRAVKEVIEEGWLYGALTELEVRHAEKVLSHIYPGGLIRFVNSGTEATMLAIRLARGYTGRNKIVKFEGCYHGAHDQVLVKSGSAAGHLGIPTSKGIPQEVAKLTLVAQYNDPAKLEELFEHEGNEIAAVIVEPVLGNYGVVPPKKEFLTALRRLTRKHGSLLILDEVITGFRLSLGGAQQYFGIKADLVTLGKIIGGGFPVGAVAGEKEIMNLLTPTGSVFNAGTFNGHPVSMAAGYATIQVLESEGLTQASETGKALAEVIDDELSRKFDKYTVVRVESMVQFYIGVDNVESPTDVKQANKKIYLKIHEELLKEKVLIAPSQLEALFTSIVHGDREIELFKQAFPKALRRVV
ncbi:MAG: glutamate-1-semialdehyde 2,1-aminomutase [Desulfurococcales archaeon]|nr:glutamate-1-semialdehyde 2,1-aminomutase [Desulfurococcales archaeon]